ncbi:MAG: beta-N-acetylhexosaminidase [Cellvibrionaceae bacterium]
MSIGPLMLDLDSLVVSSDEKELLLHPMVGGVIYFARNYESPEQIKALSDSIRQIRPDLLIAVDQEGGRVQRFKAGFTRIPAMQQFLPLYCKNPKAALALVKDSAWLMASELLAVGIDFSFAPVLDLDDAQCEVIADRSFSRESDEAIALAGAWIDGMHETGMASTGKHFPGHGSVTIDSHVGLPIDQRSFEDIAAKDLLPFVTLIQKLDAMMPAHILFPKIDPEHTVGFSQHWLQSILRNQLGFEGVIFSDDLSMEGAASGGGFIDRAKLALSAGCDMILVCNNREGAIEVLEQSDELNPFLDPQSQQRFGVMRSSKRLDFSALKQQQRWQLSQKLLSTLS